MLFNKFLIASLTIIVPVHATVLARNEGDCKCECVHKCWEGCNKIIDTTHLGRGICQAKCGPDCNCDVDQGCTYKTKEEKACAKLLEELGEIKDEYDLSSGEMIDAMSYEQIVLLNECKEIVDDM